MRRRRPTSSNPAYERALKLLGFRARSVSELRRKLLDKGESVADVNEALERLRDQKLLNDADFAKQFARGKLGSGGKSRFRVTQELGRLGIARPMADAAIEELEQDGLDLGSAVHRAAEKKWRTLQGLDAETARRRLYGFLARRGFNPDAIREALKALEA